MPENDLSPASITENLDTKLIGQRVIYFPSLPSTMDVAKREAQSEAAEGTVVIAGEQTAGKGRLKRLWLSPAGGIALSVVLHPDMSSLPYLIMIASLSVAGSIEAVTGIKPQIKWPNDVLINGKKVCGILTESLVREDRVIYAIIGIGINVNMRVADFPEIPAIATSLRDQIGENVSRTELVRNLLAEMERIYLILPDGESIYGMWRDKLSTLGESIQVKSGEGIIKGVAESVDKDGSLRLRLQDGSLTRIVAGDVTLRSD